MDTYMYRCMWLLDYSMFPSLYTFCSKTGTFNRSCNRDIRSPTFPRGFTTQHWLFNKDLYINIYSINCYFEKNNIFQNNIFFCITKKNIFI